MDGANVAQRVQTLFVDDLDGSEAEGTVQFGLDGAEYEIDLSTANKAALRDVLGPFITHGRKVGRVARRATRGGGRRAAGELNTAEVREWAKAQGIDIKERGRVPGDVVARYREATGR